MRMLDRKLGRELRASALLLTAITSIIAVGVACFVTLISSYWNLSEAKRRYYAQCRMADFSIELKKAPLTELDRVAALPGVAQIRPRIHFYVTVDLEGVEEPLNGHVLSLPDQRQPVINDIVVRSGSYFTGRRENEVIVNEFFARHHKIHPGQWIHLLLNNRRQDLFVVGTCISSEFVYLLGSGAITPDPKNFGVFYLKQSYAEEVFDFKGSANQVLGRLSAFAHGDPRDVMQQAEELLASYGVFSTTPLEEQMSNRFLSQEIQGLWSFAVISPTMFLAVAALVLNVLLSRLVEHQRTVIGTLKAIGYSDGQLFVHMLMFGVVVGVAGGVLGCGLGWWLSAAMTTMYRQFFQFPALDARFYPSVHGTGLAISVACSVLGGLRGSRAVLRLRPAEAMRPKPPRQGGAVLLERIGWLWKSLSSGWRMVLRSVVRNRVRTAAGLFAAAMGAAILVNSFMMAESPYYLIDFQFRWIMHSDMELLLRDERPEVVLREAARLPGVDRAEPVLSVACTFRHGSHHKKGAITGLAPDARLTVPRDLNERRIRIPRAGLAMNREMAAILHVEPGDWVVVEPVKGLRRARRVPVVEISDSYLGTAVYADIDYLSRLVGEERALTGVQLALDGDPAHRKALYKELKQMPALQAVTARSDMIDSIEQTVLRHQWIVILLLVMFAGVVFFSSILNASLVNLAERQREVATLRVLGYGPWQVGSLLLRESMITTLIGTALGMPLGYFLTVITAWAYASEMFRLPVVSSASTWWGTAVLAVLFGLLAHLAVQRAVHKMDWLDALKAQE